MHTQSLPTQRSCCKPCHSSVSKCSPCVLLSAPRLFYCCTVKTPKDLPPLFSGLSPCKQTPSWALTNLILPQTTSAIEHRVPHTMPWHHTCACPGLTLPCVPSVPSAVVPAAAHPEPCWDTPTSLLQVSEVERRSSCPPSPMPLLVERLWNPQMIYVHADICFLVSLLRGQPNPSAAHRGSAGVTWE